MSNTEAEKYDQFLNRLIEDAQGLDADFRNFTRLWSLHDEHLEDINEAPGTFNSFINSLRTSTVVLAHRLFDKGSVSLHKLIQIAKDHGNAINWQGGKPSSNDLKEQEDQIAALQGTLTRLRKQRNKAYAHLDEKYVLDWEALDKDFLLVEQDIREVIDLAHRILQQHYGYRYDVHKKMPIGDAVNVEHLLELINIGRKYRKQECLERAQRRRPEGAA